MEVTELSKVTNTQIMNVLDKLATGVSNLADRVEALEAAPEEVAPEEVASTVTQLAPASGELGALRAECLTAKNGEKAVEKIEKHATEGPPMLRHYIAGTLPKHMSKGLPVGHYAPREGSKKFKYATALLSHIESGGAIPGATVSSKPATGSTKAERATALRIECERRNYGDDLKSAVLADPHLHFRRDNGAMKSMSASTVRARIKAGK